jgi:hypothetical protein
MPGFGAAAAATPGMEYGGVKGAALSESTAGGSEEWRRVGARGVFSRRLVFARLLWLFTRAGARAAYLVRGIVQNGARGILFVAHATLARLLEWPKYAYAWYIGGFFGTTLF